jgi:protein SCO1/2
VTSPADHPPVDSVNAVDSVDSVNAVDSVAISARRSTGRSTRRSTVVAALVGVALALGVVVVGFGAFRPHLYSGTVLQGTEPAPPLTGLVDGQGEPFTVSAHGGDAVLVFFGYTACPDICPTTLADSARALELLGPDLAQRVEVVMVSVDPARDDPAELAGYVTHFHPSFRAVTGSPADIDRAAASYGVYYRAGPPDDDGFYTVDHTASLMGIGPDGALRVLWPSGVGPEALAADLREMLS